MAVGANKDDSKKVWTSPNICPQRICSNLFAGLKTQWNIPLPVSYSAHVSLQRSVSKTAFTHWQVQLLLNLLKVLNRSKTNIILKFEYLGQIQYDFQKSRVTGPWDHKDSVSAKKRKYNISCLCPCKCICQIIPQQLSRSTVLRCRHILSHVSYLCWNF